MTEKFQFIPFICFVKYDRGRWTLMPSFHNDDKTKLWVTKKDTVNRKKGKQVAIKCSTAAK